MEAFGLILAIVGGLVAISGYIWLLIVAFAEGALWGIVCLLFPVVLFLLLLMRPSEMWKPMLVYLAGAAVLLTGMSVIS